MFKQPIIKCVSQSWVLARVLFSNGSLWCESVLIMKFSLWLRYQVFHLRAFHVIILVCGHVMHGSVFSSIRSFQ
jgi:hypothetical protein